jgi:carbamoyl-phosphate synthase small subunit
LKKAFLRLNDGVVFEGLAADWVRGDCPGEVVFNTGMTGYVESLTDPSYTNQILVFTYPLIGNYGVQLGDAESPQIQVSGVVMSEIAAEGSHERSESSLLDWLKSQKIPVMAGVDTRALTKHLRSRGTMLGCISPDAKGMNLSPASLHGPKSPAFGQNLPTTRQCIPDTFPPVGEVLDSKPGNFGSEEKLGIGSKVKPLAPKFVSVAEPVVYGANRKKKVILVDCGAKENIVRSLLKYPVQVKKVPYGYDYTAEDFDGVLLSNGPGDPTDYAPTIRIAAKALKIGKPVFGICLGSQIMGLAAGAKTYKLPFGHRGHNQPCQQADNSRCFVTSQNHGYAIDEKTLPKDWQVSFRNLNDGSVEGIQHKTKPFFSVQFHPEAAPGPTDTEWLFKKFYEAICKSKK